MNPGLAGTQAQAIPGGYGGLQNKGVREKQGSLVDAMEALSGETGLLEETLKRAYERMTPILEPVGPSDVVKQEGRGAQSPLAENIFEYVTRIRNVRLALNELSDRVAL